MSQIWLFSYGTLRQEEVQRALFGRAVPGFDDALPGYRMIPLAITDAAVVATSGSDSHPIAVPTGDPADEVPGIALAIDAADLAAADAYEVADYRREAVKLRSGREAWVYVEAATRG